MEEHDRQAAEGEDPEGDQDVQADLDDDAVDHQRHGVGSEPQGEADDARHELRDEVQGREQLLSLGLGELRTDDADEQREEDERQDVPDRAVGMADDGPEEVLRHEHLHDPGQGQRRAGRRDGHVLLRGAAELLHEHGLRAGIEMIARAEHVHHQQPQADGDGHVQEEESEGAAGERTEPVEAAELGDAGGERGEDQRDHHEEQQAEEDLAQRVEDVRRDLPHELERRGRIPSEPEGGQAGDDAEQQPIQDTVGEGTIGFGHGGYDHL